AALGDRSERSGPLDEELAERVTVLRQLGEQVLSRRQRRGEVLVGAARTGIVAGVDRGVALDEVPQRDAGPGGEGVEKLVEVDWRGGLVAGQGRAFGQ